MPTSHQNSMVNGHNDDEKYWSSVASDTEISENPIYRFLGLIGLPDREKTVTTSSSSTSSSTTSSSSTSSFTTAFLSPLLPPLTPPLTSPLTPPLTPPLPPRCGCCGGVSTNSISGPGVGGAVAFF